MVRKLVYSVLCIAALAAAMSFKPAGRGKLVIVFKNYVGDKPLKLDSVSYKNQFGQSYTVTMFKYYVGNFHLEKTDGTQFNSHGYFIINQDDTNSMEVTIDSMPVGRYYSLSFTLGVDSIDNCSGAQSGALDPVNGMFWAWNTGYIFLKMEGISPASNSTGKRLEFHIGGYKEPADCIKTIQLNFGFFYLGEGENYRICIKTDLSRLFSSPNPVDFSKLSSVTDFHNAKAIADNYSVLFSVTGKGK
jgi:hypothetical protein